MQEQETRALLAALAEQPAPAPAVDITRALADGGRTVRRRRLLTGAAAVLAATALAGGVALAGVTFIGADPADPPVGQGGEQQSGPQVAQGAFDPLVRSVTAGWLPEQFRYRQTLLAHDKTSVHAYTRPDRQGASVALGAGTNEEIRDPDATPEPAEVNGIPAKLRLEQRPAKPGEPGAMVIADLSWQRAPGAWAWVSVFQEASVADVRGTVLRIAGEARFGGTERIRSPLGLDRLPASLTLIAVAIGESPNATPEYSFALQPSNTVGTPTQHLFHVTARPSGATVVDIPGRQFQPNGTVDGHPAWREELRFEDGTRHARLMVFEVNGFSVDLSVTHQDVFDLFGADAPVAAFRRVTVLGADPATWTDRPLG